METVSKRQNRSSTPYKEYRLFSRSVNTHLAAAGVWLWKPSLRSHSILVMTDEQSKHETICERSLEFERQTTRIVSGRLVTLQSAVSAFSTLLYDSMKHPSSWLTQIPTHAGCEKSTSNSACCFWVFGLIIFTERHSLTSETLRRVFKKSDQKVTLPKSFWNSVESIAITFLPWGLPWSDSSPNLIKFLKLPRLSLGRFTQTKFSVRRASCRTDSIRTAIHTTIQKSFQCFSCGKLERETTQIKSTTSTSRQH